MGVFEEFPFMKNCGTTRERGRNWTWGRQNNFNGLCESKIFDKMSFFQQQSQFKTSKKSNFKTFKGHMKLVPA